MQLFILSIGNGISEKKPTWTGNIQGEDMKLFPSNQL